MQFKELESTLPSGFHDAWIYNVQLDYTKHTVTLEMGISWGERDDLRKGELVLSEVHYFVAEPPQHDPMEAGSEGLWIDAIDYDVHPQAWSAALPGNLPAGTFAHCFFVNQWNSHIHFAAKSAEVKWRD